jgi:hypothetical protein
VNKKIRLAFCKFYVKLLPYGDKDKVLFYILIGIEGIILPNSLKNIASH